MSTAQVSTPVLPANFVIPPAPAAPVIAKAAPVAEPAAKVSTPDAPASDDAPYTSTIDPTLSMEDALALFAKTELSVGTKVGAEAELVALAEKEEAKAKADAAAKAAEPAAKVVEEPQADAELDAEVTAVTKNLTHEQVQAFKAKTYELRDAKRKLKEAADVSAKAAELEAKVAELEARTPEKIVDTSELDALRAKIEAQELELGGVRLEATDVYRTQITEPLTKLVNEAVTLTAGIDLLDEADVRAAFQLTGRERAAEISRIASELNEFDKQEFFAIARNHATVTGKKAELAANVKDSYAKIQADKASAEQKATAEHKAKWGQATQEAWQKLQTDTPILSPIEGHAEWNAGIEQAKNFANTVSYKDLDITSQSEVMHRAAAWNLIKGYNQSLSTALGERDTTIATLQSQIERLTGALPNAGPSSPSIDKSGADPDAGLTFEEAMTKRMNAAGTFR